jgi:hypothetical protein
MKKKRSVLKDLLFVSISSFIVVAAWIGFNLYHTWVTTTITPDMQVQISAITPDFDTATLQKLKARKQITPINTLSNKTPIEPSSAPETILQPSIVTPSTTAAELPAATPTSVPVQLQNQVQVVPQSAVQPRLTDIPVTVQGQ